MASQAEDFKKVRSLQKLMLRSRANALLSVWRVTQLNVGRMTAGVDGKVVLDDEGRAEMVCLIQRADSTVLPQPVRRVYIPKQVGNSAHWGFR